MTAADVLDRPAGVLPGVPECEAMLPLFLETGAPPSLMRCPELPVGRFQGRCADPGCEHERTLVNGAMLTRLPRKVQLLSEPGAPVARRTLTAAEALEHAAAAIDAAAVKPAGRSPMWDAVTTP